MRDASLKWLSEDINIDTAAHGMGGVPQVGRLMLLRGCMNFVTKLRNLITSAVTGLFEPNINIHIFTGISGGTGAGTFLDVCYILQKVLEDMSLTSAYTCGYFFLPDVNEAAGSHPDYIYENGFASMKELDYAMNFKNNGGKWKQTYNWYNGVSQTVESSEPPVKLAHIVTARGLDGTIRANAFHYAIHTVVEYVLEFIMKPYVPEDKTDVQPFTMESHIANIKANIDCVKKQYGGCYDYCVLGAAKAYLPYKDIYTYLAAKLFEGFVGLEKRQPGIQEVQEFVADTLRLRYEDIKQDLERGMPNIPKYDVDAKTLYEQTQGLREGELPNILGRMRDAFPKIEGKLAENMAAMLSEETKGGAVEEDTRNIVSLQGRIKDELIKRAKNEQYGVYYATALLRSGNMNDLGDVIKNYRARQASELAQAGGDLGLREEGLARALRELQNSNMFSRKGKAQAYTNAAHAYYQQYARWESLRRMGNLLEELDAQLDRLYTGFFKIYQEVLGELRETFLLNLQQLSEPAAKDTGYAKKIASVNDKTIKDKLDAIVTELGVEKTLSDFVGGLLEAPEKWIEKDENKIVGAVRTHFLSALGEHAKRAMDIYLQDKYGTTDPHLLQQKIQDEIIKPIGQNSSPLFWVDGSVFQIEAANQFGYLSIPIGSSATDAAANEYLEGSKEKDALTKRSSWATDRISILRFLCGIPLFSYKGINNYEAKYKESHRFGIHLYEGAKEDPRDNRRLINILPIGCKDETNLTKTEKENMQTYENAVSIKVINTEDVGSQREYRLYTFDATKVEGYESAVDRILKTRNVMDAKILQAQIEKEGLPYTGESLVFFRAGGRAESEEKEQVAETSEITGDHGQEGQKKEDDRIAADYILGSLTYMEQLRKQLSVAERYEAVKRALEELIGTEKDLQGFADALETGVIRKQDTYIYTYQTDDEYGSPQQLTDIQQEPFGEKLQLYSAFYGYRELSGEMKKDIADAVKRHKTEQPETVDAAMAWLTEELAEEKVKQRLGIAKKAFPESFAEISAFYKSLRQEADAFAATR